MATRLRSEQGSSIIMLIGITAALALLIAAVVTLVGNVQANTLRDRYRATTFNGAESALDSTMYQLGVNWPTDASTAPSFDANAFLSTLRTAAVHPEDLPTPDPGWGPAASVKVYDNPNLVPTDGWPVGYSSANPPPWDANGDSYLYVQAQVGAGNYASAVQSEVQRTTVNTAFPHGVAVYVGGNMTSNGGGNNPKVSVTNAGGYGVTGYVAGSLDTSSVFTPGQISVVQGASVPSADSLFPPALVQQIVDLAKGLGRYYDLTAGAAIPSDISGVCVINAKPGQMVELPNNGTINSLASPGILMILGGNTVTIDMGGNCTYTGVLYTTGTFQSAHGTPQVVGMVICVSDLDMKGTPAVMYDDSVISKLAMQYTLAVVQVPNTWQQISAVTH